MSIIESPIRPVSAGLDDDQPTGYGLSRMPNGLYILLRLNLSEDAEFAAWTPCAHAMHEEVIEGAIRRWTGLSIPLWWIRGENRTEAS